MCAKAMNFQSCTHCRVQLWSPTALQTTDSSEQALQPGGPRKAHYERALACRCGWVWVCMCVWGWGGVGKKPWCCILFCSWRRPLADRHSLPFPSLSFSEGPLSRCFGGGGGWASVCAQARPTSAKMTSHGGPVREQVRAVARGRVTNRHRTAAPGPAAAHPPPPPHHTRGEGTKRTNPLQAHTHLVKGTRTNR